MSVCRGCCCGLVDDRPSPAATALVAQMRRGLSGAATMRVTDCLDVCDMSDVVVVSPSPAARRAGARAVWLARVADRGAARHVVAWLRAGGPGKADMPPALADQVFSPPRRVRASTEGGR